MKKGKIILSLLILMLAAGSIYGYMEYNRKTPDLASIKPIQTITAPALLKAFQVNEAAAGKQFIDKVIAVSGTIKNISTDNIYYTLSLGDPAGIEAVRCSLDSIEGSKAALLNKGTAITIKGICTGYNADELLGAEVILNRCLIENNK